MLIHVFIRKALQEGRGELLPMLFAGRLTTADVITLAPFRDSGLIAAAGLRAAVGARSAARVGDHGVLRRSATPAPGSARPAAVRGL